MSTLPGGVSTSYDESRVKHNHVVFLKFCDVVMEVSVEVSSVQGGLWPALPVCL